MRCAEQREWRPCPRDAVALAVGAELVVPLCQEHAARAAARVPDVVVRPLAARPARRGA